MKSYEPKDKLVQLRNYDPEMAKVVEQFCVGLMATRGALIIYEQNATLSYVNRLIEPWILIVENQVAANARSPEKARAAVMKRWNAGKTETKGNVK